MNDPTTSASDVPSPASLPPAAAVRVRGRVLGWSAASAALLFVVIVAGNAVLARASQRIDLTEERLWTLTDATKRILAAMPEKAVIEVFWSEEIPDSALPFKRRVAGLLEEYESGSAGRLTVEWVDMSGGTEGAGDEKAQKRGLRKHDWQATTAKKAEIAEGYMGLAVLYEDKTEKIDRLITVENRLEYEITSRLWKLARDKPPVVGLVQDMPAMNFMNPQGGQGRFTTLATLLEQVYGTGAKTWLSLDDAVPPDVSVLVVAAPKDLDEKTVYHLEQFLLRGGKVLLLLDPVRAEEGSLRASPATKSGLEDWLKGYGLEVAEGIVGDYEAMAFGLWWPPRAPGKWAVEAYPYWPMLLNSNLASSNPATVKFHQVPVYFPSELVVDEKAQEIAARRATVLAATTEKGFRQTEPSRLYDESEPPENQMSKKVLAVVLEGPFESKWKGKPAPGEAPPEPAAMDGEAGMTTQPGMEGPAMTEEPAMGDAPMGDAPMGDAPMGDAPMDEPPMGEAPMGEAPPPPAGMPDDGKPADGGPKGPRGPDGDDGAPPAPPAGGEKKDEPKALKLESGRGVLVVLGDADLVSDEFSGRREVSRTGGLTQYNGVAGFAFVVNLVDWMSGGEDLIALRSRDASPRRLTDIEEGTITAIQWANYLGVPLLVLLSGLVVFVVRRQKR